MLQALLAALVLQPPNAALASPMSPDSTSAAHAIVARATRAVEHDSADVLEALLLRTLAGRPADRPSLLGLATLARLTFRPERADSFATLLSTRAPGARDAYALLADLGAAQTLANSLTPVLADSVLTRVRREAQALGSARVEANALVALASLRSRTVGTRAAMTLLAESRRVYPASTPAEESLRLCLEGSFGTRLGDTTSYRKITEGMVTARAAQAWRSYAQCFLLRAQINEARGYFAGAFAALDTAVRWMRSTHSEAALAVALQWGAFVRFQQGDLARARTDYLEAIALADRARDAAVEAWSYTGLAQIALSVSDFSGGREYLARARTLHQQRNDRWGYATVRELEGDWFDAIGDLVAAREALYDAVAVQTSIGQQLLAIAPLRRLIRVEIEGGRLDQADSALQMATRFAAMSRNQGFLNELPYHQAGLAIARGAFQDADSLLQSMTRIAQGSEGPSDVEYPYWIRRADVALRRGHVDEAEQALRRAVVSLGKWRSAQSEKDLRLRAAQARRPWGTFGEEAPALIARLADAGRVASAFELSEATRARELLRASLQRSALAVDSAAIRSRATADIMSLAQVQAQLDDSSAMLAYVAGRGRTPTTMFIVTRASSAWRRAPPLDSLGPSLERYLRLTAAGAAPRALARSVSDAILTPALQALPAGISRLLIVPELSLYRMPFDALPLTDGRYVADQFRVAIAASATLAMLPPIASPVRVSGSLVAFGDPAFVTDAKVLGTLAVGTTSDKQRAALLPRLPASGAEARRVARYVEHARVFVRDDASAAALRALDLREVRVLHLATHALMDDRSLQRNRLALAPSGGSTGFLGPDELSALSLTNALVVLSGCRTVGGVVLNGEGLRGLTAPFLEAGARAVIATQWAIGDAAALPMVDRMYAHMAEGLDVATALQRAKREAIRDGVRPAVWAAFTLVGDGSMRVPLTPARMTLLPWGRALGSKAPR